MNLSIDLPLKTSIDKKLFKLKEKRTDGFLFKICKSTASQKVRLSHCCFHNNGQTLVSADNEGNFYIVNYLSGRYWGLPKLQSCNYIRFSNYHPDILLVATKEGGIILINYETAYIYTILEGHKFAVQSISFQGNECSNICLSSSQYEAIIWDLQTYSKVQILTLNNKTGLKFVLFIPASSYILACFQDDVIQIWNSKGYETVKQFLPMNHKNSIKTLALTRNGQVMVVAGSSSILNIYQLDVWKLSKIINLPESIHSVRQIDFVCQPFDGGSNKLLVILSGQGVIYFYDIERNIIISELTSKCEINKFSINSKGTFISCVLCLGEIEVYSMEAYIIPPMTVKVQPRHINIQKKKYVQNIPKIRDEMADILDIDKLKAILNEFGQYPEAHRVKIWEKILQLPNNIDQYNNVINQIPNKTLPKLILKYPLTNKMLVNNLKILVNNLVIWCPFFGSLEYLPNLVLPFVSFLNRKPHICFEIMCTIILNWCQNWFEYSPLPPFNVLNMIENLLYEHDPQMLYFFAAKGITTHIYAWQLLKTVLSEVLNQNDWLQLWDHILTNEPAFLLCSVAAYSIIQKKILLNLKRRQDFVIFYQNRNPINVRRFIRLTYVILDRTCDELHPRQYLQDFQKLQTGNYPIFIDYPKTIFDYQTEELDKIDGQIQKLSKINDSISKKGMENEWEEQSIIKEECRRLIELENTYLKTIQKKKDSIEMRLEEFNDFKKSNDKIQTAQMKNIISPSDEHLIKSINSKERYLLDLKDLMRFKFVIKSMLERAATSGDADNKNCLKNHQSYIEKAMKKFSHSLGSLEDLKKNNILTGMNLLELLIAGIENEVKCDFCCNQALSVQNTENVRRAISKLLKDLIEGAKNS